MAACGGCSLRTHTRGPEPYPVGFWLKLTYSLVSSCDWSSMGGAGQPSVRSSQWQPRKAVVRAEVKSQEPLCCAAELKRAGELSWPPGPPVQRAPMVVCLLGASGMAVQWRAHQIVEASVAGQPRVRLPVLDYAMHSEGPWTGCGLVMMIGNELPTC